MKSRDTYTSTNAADARPPIPLHEFCSDGKISQVTAWRWRKKGWLKTVNICGRQYVMPEAIAEFNRRAAAGEFASEHKTPTRGGAR
jgi:hypothetical protein